MNNKEKRNINLYFRQYKKPKKRNYLEYIKQCKLSNEAEIKNRHIYNNNNGNIHNLKY